ncbi:hypothetical protein D3C81_1737270 [compost metagenome]
MLRVEEFHFRRCCLQTHHHGVHTAAEQHEQCGQDIHDADLFMVDRSQPFTPQVAPFFKIGKPDENPDGSECDTDHGSVNQGFAVNLKFV